MKSVAGYFRKQVCRQINLDELTRNIKSIRIKTGDRAVLRAIHYLHENERVDKLINALKNKNFNLFLDLINQSGNSSWKYLQNCYIPENPREQNLSIGLALTEIFISKIQTGACRVHGGGFEGTILAFIPNKHIKDYIKMMENVFGIDSVKKLEIRYNGSMIIF